jgi:hypothetical protein
MPAKRAPISVPPAGVEQRRLESGVCVACGGEVKVFLLHDHGVASYYPRGGVIVRTRSALALALVAQSACATMEAPRQSALPAFPCSLAHRSLPGVLADHEALDAGAQITMIRIAGEDRIVVTGVASSRTAKGAVFQDLARIWVEGVGSLAVPEVQGSAGRAMLPVAVPHAGTWAAVWAEGADDASVPPGLFFGELWWARHDGSGWIAPQLLASAEQQLRWARGRTIRYAPDGEPYFLVVAAGSAGSHALFGTLERGLDVVAPLRADVLAAGFAFNVDDVAMAASRRTESLAELVFLESADHGRTWTKPQVIGPTFRDADRVMVQYDTAGNVHVLAVGWGAVHHHVRRVGARAWSSTVLPVPAPVIGGSAFGINRCGRPALFVEALEPGVRLDYYAYEWTEAAGWSDPRAVFDGYIGAHLFDGHTRDGRWFIGLNALESENAPHGTPHIRIAEP